MLRPPGGEKCRLSSKVKALDEFRDHYRKRMATLRPQWAILTDPKGASPAQVRLARSGIARLLTSQTPVNASVVNTLKRQSLPPSPSNPPFSSKGPTRVDQGGPSPNDLAETSNVVRLPLIAEDPPRQEQLAEDGIVRLTPEIRRLADQLDRDPARIYAFVHNNIDFEHYPGFMQNSQSVLWSGRGNDADQATLLIALLRASGIGACYVRGRIGMSIPQLMNWIGATVPIAADAMTRFITDSFEFTGNQVTIGHVWAEAFIDSGQGGRWAQLDPSFKTFDYSPGVLIRNLAFEREPFLGSVQRELASDRYFTQLRDFLEQNRPGTAVSDVPYQGLIVPVSDKQIPHTLPYEVIAISERRCDPSPDLLHRLVFSVEKIQDGSVLLEETAFVVAEISHQSLTLSFGGAREADAQTIKMFGGLSSTPVFLADTRGATALGR